MSGLGPMEPLQRFPQQSLKIPTRERLLLCNDDAGGHIPIPLGEVNGLTMQAQVQKHFSEPAIIRVVSHRATKATQEILEPR